MKDLEVVIVLKTGGDYDYRHVNNLARAVKYNLTVPYHLTCMTDDSNGFDMSYVDKVVSFRHNYPKWWGKIEMFKPNLFNNKKVLYFDLDTFIIGNIDFLSQYNGKFSGLSDFYFPESFGSGVMIWDADECHHVYENFVNVSTATMNNYHEGDQKWIREQIDSIDYIQDYFPNEVVSYKVHCVQTDRSVKLPDKAKVICFHGKPRPHDVTEPCIAQFWNP